LKTDDYWTSNYAYVFQMVLSLRSSN
jgi:hypothetical protein